MRDLEVDSAMAGQRVRVVTGQAVGRLAREGVLEPEVAVTNNLTLTGTINSGNTNKTINVLNTGVTTFSGAITNSGTSSVGGALNIAGTGILVLTGTNTYPGTTAISGGRVLINTPSGGSGTSTNTVTVNAGGTLGGIGNIGGNVNFASGGQAYLFKSAGSSDTPLTLAGNLALNGNTVVVDLGGTTTLTTGTYNLLNYAGTLSGSFTHTPIMVNGSLASGKVGTIDLSTPNQVNLVVATGTIPPPNFKSGSLSLLLPSHNVSLTATGAIGATYKLWATTNVALAPVTNTWTLLQSGTISSNPFTLQDLTATNFARRFYIFTAP